MAPDALADPTFALDVLTAMDIADPTLVGRVLDYLRNRADARPMVDVSARAIEARVTVATAVASYEAGPLALMAKRTIDTYRTWIRRLVQAHGESDTRRLTAGDLQDLIAMHVLKKRDEDERRLSGRTAESHGVTAYRHLWAYLVRKGWASENIAMDLTKRPRPESRRRGIRPEEAILVRHWLSRRAAIRCSTRSP